MATLADYSDDLLNTVTGLLSSDDSRLVSPQIDFWITSYRAKFMLQYTDYGKEIDPQFIQDLGLWQLEQVDKAEDGGGSPIEFGKAILRTINPVPKFIEFPMQRGRWFGSTDKQAKFILTTPFNIRYKLANPYAGAYNVIYAYPIGNYWYFCNCCNENTDLKYVNIQGILADPQQGNYYYSEQTNGIAFNRNTDTFPMSDVFWDMIKKEIIANEFRVSSATYDPSNNASDNNSLQLTTEKTAQPQ